jgi:fermentation-respiration switch protein FrsA (DUF1100 family)
MPFLGDPTPPRRWMIGPIGRSWLAGNEAIHRTLKRMRTARRIDPGRVWGLPWEDVELRTRDGVRLAAWFVPAADDAPDVAGLMAVVHHHYGGQKATALPWLELLHRLGIPTLVFDARGHAASDLPPPGRGSFVKRADDVRAACAWLRARGARRILGVGQSQGAATLMIGAGFRRDLVGLIVDSGPTPDMFTAAWGLAGNLLGSAGRREPWTRAILAARILPGTEPLLYLPALWSRLAILRRRPLLWIHGDRDVVITRSWSKGWFVPMRPRSGRWRSLLVRDADHVRCLQVGGEPVEQAVRDFIAGLMS